MAARPAPAARALSQNFLTDRTSARQLARLAAPFPHKVPLLLEVGAGKGALTEHLATRCHELRAYEIDRRLLPGPRTRFAATPQVTVIGADFLTSQPPRTPFSGVGGSLRASLRRVCPRRRVDAAFRAAGLERGVLVGAVTPGEWLRLFEVLGQRHPRARRLPLRKGSRRALAPGRFTPSAASSVPPAERSPRATRRVSCPASTPATSADTSSAPRAAPSRPAAARPG